MINIPHTTGSGLILNFILDEETRKLCELPFLAGRRTRRSSIPALNQFRYPPESGYEATVLSSTLDH
jgi:hypothetical protein